MAKFECTTFIPGSKPRVSIIKAEKASEARKLADEQSPVSGCRIVVKKV